MARAKHSYCHCFNYIMALALTGFILLTSCQNKSHSEADTESEIPSSMPDSIVEDNIEILTDTIPTSPKSKSLADIKDFMNESEDSEKYAEGIIQNIAEESEEYAYKLLCNKYDRFIVVDKSRMKVVLFDKYGRMEKTYGMACAKNYGTKHKKGDSCTPEGFFSVEGIYDSTDWLFTDDNGVTSQKKGQFGPRFIRIRIPNTSQIGIHGTCAPWSIGSRASHGCIRIKNENILELVDLVEPGMPVIIVPGRKDIAQNLREGVDIPWIPTTKTAKNPTAKVIEEQSKENATLDTVSPVKPDSVETSSNSHTEEIDTINISYYHIPEE